MAVDPARLKTVSLFDGIGGDDLAMMAEHMEERIVAVG